MDAWVVPVPWVCRCCCEVVAGSPCRWFSPSPAPSEAVCPGPFSAQTLRPTTRPALLSPKVVALI